MLTLEETKKYSRQIKLEGFGASSQEKLKNSKVLVVGLGGLGSPLSTYLTCSGVGSLGLIDFDRVDYSNLGRQILYTEKDIGLFKVDVALKKLKEFNSLTNISIFREKLTLENIQEIFCQYHFIVDGSDNFETRFLVNDTCVKMGIPFLHGSVSGFEGFVGLFNGGKSSPCYRCLHPEIPIENLSCSDIGILSTSAGLVGIHMAHEVIKYLAGIAPSLADKAILINNNGVSYFNITKDPDCPICGKGKIKNEFPEELSIEKFNQIREKVIILDIREEWEFKERNLGGINIPISAFTNEKIERFKDKELVILCYSGEKSRRLVKQLKKEHFKKIFNLKGGIREAILN